MKQKILVVLTSVGKYPNLNRATGLWLGEAVHFVKKVETAAIKWITLALKAAILRSTRIASLWLIPSIGSGIERKNL